MLVPCNKGTALHHYDDSCQKEECPHNTFAPRPIDDHVANTRAARVAREVRGGPLIWNRPTAPSDTPRTDTAPSDG